MKEIKAYIRRDRASHVVEKLQRAGASGITLLEVHAVGYGEEPNYFVRAEDVFTRYRVAMVKLELVCADHDADEMAAVVEEAARTGSRGDGMIFVAQVSLAIRIRDGASGEAAL